MRSPRAPNCGQSVLGPIQVPLQSRSAFASSPPPPIRGAGRRTLGGRAHMWFGASNLQARLKRDHTVQRPLRDESTRRSDNTRGTILWRIKFSERLLQVDRAVPAALTAFVRMFSRSLIHARRPARENLHTRICTPKSAHQNLHAKICARELTHENLHAKTCMRKSTHENLHTKIYTRESTHENLHTRIYTRESTHENPKQNFIKKFFRM